MRRGCVGTVGGAVLIVLCLAGPALAQGTGDWTLVGSASLDGAKIVITRDEGERIGAAWYARPVDLSRDADLRFRVFLGDKDEEGADGLTFILAAEQGGTDAGQGLGYQGIERSLAIEIDTYPNDGEHLGDDLADPAADHVTVDIDGSVDHHDSDRPLAELEDIEDGQEHVLRIQWVAAEKRLRVFIDDMETPKIEYGADVVAERLGGQSAARLGIAGSTGVATNRQYVVVQKMVVGETEGGGGQAGGSEAGGEDDGWIVCPNCGHRFKLDK